MNKPNMTEDLRKGIIKILKENCNSIGACQNEGCIGCKSCDELASEIIDEFVKALLIDPKNVMPSFGFATDNSITKQFNAYIKQKLGMR